MSMTEQRTASPWEMRHRLRFAIEESGVGRVAIATHLGVSPGTITNWTRKRATPKLRDLRAVAEKTGFRLEWILTGIGPWLADETDGPSDQGVSATAWTRLRSSSPRPTHSLTPDLIAA